MSALSPFTPPNLPEAGRKIKFGQLVGSSQAIVIAELAQKTHHPMLVIAADSQSANRLELSLKFFAPELEILNFPDWETLPYDNFSPHQDIISQRLLILSRLPQLTQGILIIPISSLLQRLPPNDYLVNNNFALDKGDKINLNEIRLQLEKSGYHSVGQVMEHGEFTIRGSILDIFPAGSELPYRIDLFDNEVETIRTFDPDTQRSISVVENIRLLPAREFPLTDHAITLFRQNWREKFSGDPSICSIYQDISQGIASAGIEYYLPLFFTNTLNLLDYLSPNTLIIRETGLQEHAETFWQEIDERYSQMSHDITRPILPPNDLYLTLNECFAILNNFAQIEISKEAVKEGTGYYNFSTEKLPELSMNNKATVPLEQLQNFLAATNGRTLFCAESAGRKEVLTELLKTINIKPKTVSSWQEFLQQEDTLAIIASALDDGFILTTPTLNIITETQLFGQQVMQRRRRKIKSFDNEAVVRNLSELSIGAPVVHIDHGVGRYQGLQTLTVGEVQTEFLMLEYSGGDKLYVPVASLHLISRYSGVDIDHAPLNRLGTEQWEKNKRKAAEQVRDVAAELLDIYARRAARQGFQFDVPETQYAAFAAAFPFEETPDQEQAIQQVIGDMTSGRPMDRLICGDVGFGKTEVAMRATFIAVQSGKQVAILVPTTLLAQQHFQNFQDRFAEWPIKVEMLSRFRTAKEQKQIIDLVNQGKVDILVGTHKLLQSEINFKDLGLLIIDEEHRFGVHQKEKLKALRADVDILTLTATPIPRTLNMAFSGLREFSIIATPPAKRLAIKTFVRELNNNLIREAILRELLRGGQIYYLHNEVESIQKTAEKLTELIPQARVAVAHGQMHERELEKVMADFYHQRFNILVCTTIIETGIDIPTTNTIIIERADKFGLAQLHQLRGRVGRSHHQAYAYLLTPHKKAMTPDAVKRLDAIATLEDLGVGFTLATHDLEIRGAGELLGDQQSGNMQAIGFSLYMELLEHAVNAIKSGKNPELTKPLHSGTEIDLNISTLIPENYIPDVHTRLIFYKRLSSAKNPADLQELQVEMIDRFGPIPQPTTNLFQITQLKLNAQRLGIKKLDASAKGGRIEFLENANINPTHLIKLIQSQPHIYKFDGPTRFRFNWDEVPGEQRIKEATLLLGKLGEPTSTTN